MILGNPITLGGGGGGGVDADLLIFDFYNGGSQNFIIKQAPASSSDYLTENVLSQTTVQQTVAQDVRARILGNMKNNYSSTATFYYLGIYRNDSMIEQFFPSGIASGGIASFDITVDLQTGDIIQAGPSVGRNCAGSMCLIYEV